MFLADTAAGLAELWHQRIQKYLLHFFAIKNTVDIPVKFIGVGEQIDDMEPFDADMFVRALLEMEEEQ